MRLILYLLMLGIGASSWAQALSSQQALQRALNSQQAVGSSAPMKAATMQPQYELTLMDDATNPAYYVFTPLNGQGYLIVSGDEAVIPVLGYSDNGVLDPDNLPENMVSWLAQYAEQIEWARANGVIYKAAPSIIDNRTPIAPLCSTKWDQDTPFNDLCPRWSGYDYNCVTGCTATAMSQLMKYHNYPESASFNASYFYYYNSKRIYVYDQVNYTFDWENMLDDYYSEDGYNETQAQAVAELMYSSGLSLKMMYSPNSSMAINTNVPVALVNNFGYDNNIFEAFQKYHETEEWEQMVYDQLRYVGPVAYSGQSDTGGHSFVCDGYDKNGYFHINWGWGGMSDGYFLLNCLDPSSQGIGGSSSGYVMENAFTGGIQPPGATYIHKEVTASQFVLTSGCYNFGQSMPYSFYYVYNMNAVCPDIHLGLKLVNKDDGSVIYRKITTQVLKNIDCGNGIWTQPGTIGTTIITNDIPYGNYTIYPAWYEEDEIWQPLYIDESSNRFYNLIIDENGWTVSLSDIEVVSFTGSDTLINGEPYSVTLEVKNPTKYSSTAYYTVLMANEDNYYTCSNDILKVELEANQSATLTYDLTIYLSSVDTSVTYNLYLVDGSNNKLSTPISLKVKEKEEILRPTLKLNYLSYKELNDNTLNITWDVESEVNMSLTNTSDFAGTGRYKFALHYYENNTYYSQKIAYSPWYEVYLEAGETKDLATTFVINESATVGLPETGTYYMAVIDDNYDGYWDWLSEWEDNCFVNLIIPIQPDPIITLSKTSLKLYPGDTYELGIDITPDEVMDTPCSVYTSNEDVVTVEGTTLTAVGIGEAKITVACGKATATCKVRVKDPNVLEEVILGDINDDGDVSVTDAVALVSYILAQTPENFNIDAADVNSDGDISVSDVVCIVNIVLGVADYSKSSPSTLYTESFLTMDDLALQPNLATLLPVTLSSDRDFTAMQFDIKLPVGIEMTSVEGASLCNGHAVAWNKLDQNLYRVLVYALSNNAFRCREGEIVSLGIMADNADVAGDIVISNGMGVTANGLSYSLPECRATAGTNRLCLIAANDLQMRLDGRTLHINATAEMPLTITTVSGVSTSLSLKPGENTYTFSAPGLYIVANRKLMVE